MVGMSPGDFFAVVFEAVGLGFVLGWSLGAVIGTIRSLTQ